MTNNRVTASEVARRLADRAPEVAPMLLPGGKESAGIWSAGDLNGNAGKSVQVHLRGAKQGRWAEYADSKGPDTFGDLLDLWRVTRRLSAAEAISEAKKWLGIHEAEVRAVSKSYAVPTSNGVHPPPETGKALRYMIRERRLTRETIAAFKVGVQDEKKAIVFECYDPRGTLINRSYRTLDKKFSQEKGCAPCLFGWQALSEEAYRAKTVTITEGQFDAMTFHQWGIPALSIPNGSGQAWIETSWDDLEVFDRIYLAFDADAAGIKNAREVAIRLGRHRCYIVLMPHKDANECLTKGCTADDANLWLMDAKPLKVDNFVTATEIQDRLIEHIRPKEEAFSIPLLKLEWPKKGLFFRNGEMTVWTGGAGTGKSTFLNFMLINALVRKTKIFVCSLEMPVEVTIHNMISAALSGSETTEDLAKEFLKVYGGFITFCDVVGTINQDVLLEMMRFSFHRFGTTIFVIDSLMRIEDLEEDHPEQGKFINRLIKFADETKSHVHLVAHARKAMPGQKMSKDDVKGSSLLINNPHTVVSIDRNAAKDKKRKDGSITEEDERVMHDTEIIVHKQRSNGWLGSFFLKFNPQDYTYSKR